MKILWFTWKDSSHPQAGGAEKVGSALGKALAAEGHEVIFLTAGFPGCKAREHADGCRIIRSGNRWTVYWHAYRYYAKHLRGWADITIDEVNTMPFFARFYAKGKNVLLVHQLCREIWFYQMFFPLDLIGYALEPLYLRLLSSSRVITVSESTKKDLMRCGFKEDSIRIIRETIDIAPVPDITAIPKYAAPTVVSLGSIRRMKRTDEIIRAFEIAKAKLPELRLIVAGDWNNDFGRKAFRMARHSKYAASIKFCGKITAEEKIELLQNSHLLLAASVKEGWGLVVTEAGSQGTPAVVYGVDGLRDSVRHGETGLVCEHNSPKEMAANILALLSDRERYEHCRRNAWEWSKEMNIKNCARDFKEHIMDHTK